MQSFKSQCWPIDQTWAVCCFLTVAHTTVAYINWFLTGSPQYRTVLGAYVPVLKIKLTSQSPVNWCWNLWVEYFNRRSLFLHNTLFPIPYPRGDIIWPSSDLSLYNQGSVKATRGLWYSLFLSSNVYSIYGTVSSYRQTCMHEWHLGSEGERASEVISR